MKKKEKGNSIFTLFVQKNNGVWAFDDPKRGLVDEPFIAGADTLLDKMSNNGTECTIIFSEIKFPGAKLTLNYVRGKIDEGTDYYCQELKHELWVCPATAKYFKKSPKIIYLDYKVVEEKELV